MATIPPSSAPTFVVIDASVAIAVASREARSEQKARAKITEYTAQGCKFLAPGVLLSESLYVLCKKRESGTLTEPEYAQAILDLDTFVSILEPGPIFDFELVLQAEAIQGQYSCRRSADAIYIALAEHLAKLRPTCLITFDQEMPKQAASHATGVIVEVL